jgi:hypothetical protein
MPENYCPLRAPNRTTRPQAQPTKLAAMGKQTLWLDRLRISRPRPAITTTPPTTALHASEQALM